MKDYMKLKITKIACKFAVKSDTKAEKILWELSKEGKAFCIYLSLYFQDLTLCLS